MKSLFGPSLTKRYWQNYILLGIVFFTTTTFVESTASNRSFLMDTLISANDTTTRKQLLKLSREMSQPNTIYNASPFSFIFPGKVKSDYQLTSVQYELKHIKANKENMEVQKKFIYSQSDKWTLYSTGLYAIPGQPFYITSSLNTNDNDIAIVVGSHSDFLGAGKSMLEAWKRAPGVASYFGVDKHLEYASSPFGGLIYVAVRPEADSLDLKITFDKVIRSPLFQLDKTTLRDWKAQLASNCAPWGEIASDNVVITLPDSILKQIGNPRELLETWDEIIGSALELAQIRKYVTRPIRIVVDKQISNGILHSGYPIMVEHDHAKPINFITVFTDKQALLQPSEGGTNWGLFHELGHNFQNSDWVFEGTTEVTCNLFSLYIFDKVIHTRNGAHPSIAPDHRKYLVDRYFAETPSYDRLIEDPFLTLIPFIQIQAKFGWEPFKRAFKSYIKYPGPKLSAGAATQKQSEYNLYKINRFVETLSVAAQANLVPFFRLWGIPVDIRVEKRVASFHPWIPKELKKYTTAAATY